jgi:hypothetical protein
MAKKKIKRLQIKEVLDREIDRAGRYALSSLLPPEAVDGTNTAIKKAIMQLRRSRNHRLAELRDVGLGPLCQHGTFRFMLGCPPVGAFTRERLTPCQRPLLCPFCWARQYVYEPFEKLAKLLKYLRLNEDPDDSGDFENLHDLLEIHTWRTYEEGVSPQLPLLWIKNLKGGLVQQSLKKSPGAFVLCVLLPPTAENPHYRLHHRILAFWPTFQKLHVEEFEDADGGDGSVTTRTIKEIPSPSTTLAIAAALGRVSAYPRELFELPPRDFLELWGRLARRVDEAGKRVGGLRMAGYYGKLRGTLLDELLTLYGKDRTDDSPRPDFQRRS